MTFPDPLSTATNSLEEDVCFFCPQVPPTTAKVEGVNTHTHTQAKKTNAAFCLNMYENTCI